MGTARRDVADPAGHPGLVRIQIEMFRDCLLEVAPVVARDAVRRLRNTAGDPYNVVLPNEVLDTQRRQIAREASEFAAELALHLSARYRAYHDAALSEAPPAQDTPATRSQKAGTGLKSAPFPAHDL
jgi:hypothetical protein